MYAVGGTHRISKEGLGPIHQLTEEGDRPLHRLPPSLHSSQPVFRHRGTDTLSVDRCVSRIPSGLNPRDRVFFSFEILASRPASFQMPRLVIRYFHLPSSLSPIRQKNGRGEACSESRRPPREKGRREERGTSSFRGQVEIGGARSGRKEGRKERCYRRVPNRISGELSIPGGEAFGYPPVRISFRLDEDGLAGRRWSTATGIERKRGERRRRGNAKRSWPGPGRLPRFTNYSISPAN